MGTHRFPLEFPDCHPPSRNQRATCRLSVHRLDLDPCIQMASESVAAMDFLYRRTPIGIHSRDFRQSSGLGTALTMVQFCRRRFSQASAQPVSLVGLSCARRYTPMFGLDSPSFQESP